MYIIISLFFAYSMGVISYEFGFFSYMFIAVFVLLFFNSYYTKKYIYNSVIITFLILSFINCYYNSISKLSQHIDENIEIAAKIKDRNISESSYSSYNASVISINNVILPGKENTVIYIDSKYDIKENSIIKANVNVADSNISKNKLLFNYKNYLRAKKISAVVFAEDNITTIKENYSYFNTISANFKNYTEKMFYNSLNDSNADIILSILLGNVDYLDENFYDNVKVMGLAHIFAVSGTHIVLIYGFLLTVLKYCGLNRRARLIITWIIMWCYGFLIGFPISVMRSLVMFTLLFGAEIFYRKYSSLNAIGLAALILTVYNPFWLFDAGFLLSFSAALSIIIYNKYILKNIQSKNTIIRLIYLYLFLMLFTLPVIAYFFNYVPVMGIVYNILLLPIFTILMIYGFILLIFNGFVPFLLVIPFRIFDYLLYSLRYTVNFTEKFGFNGFTIQTMTIPLIAYFYILIIFVIYVYNNNNSPIKKSGIYTLIVMYIVTFMTPANNLIYINVADAGQGLFTHVKYRNTDLIIDCGSSNNRDFGKYTVLPYLIKRGINQIDGVFISHWDSDHYSGLNDLLSSKIKVDNIFAPATNNEIIKDISILNKGMSYRTDKLNIDILWPEKDIISDKTNNTSLVMLINFNNKKILFTGDIEKDVENIIIDDIPEIDILLVPHHGSSTSSSDKFVYNSNPEIAVFSYGKNKYGIPHREVIERYKNEKSLILSTYEHGEINFVLKDDKIYYNTYTDIKSENYYELYFLGFVTKLMAFCILLIYIKIQGRRI
ncbi:DNA internalization-related competence protein ComEC/Rec2 [Sedimentibacter sp.]|uniref:DNA internalization-related competence protein ComEC/Rec2 n=2 Tax=Sedimentibacter sp. TaxID=1960295 RepID=UPI0028A9B8D5|nr:DNA internalization-related competence protein ComEC/Rec2 [Sedimentibacter sp.]